MSLSLRLAAAALHVMPRKSVSRAVGGLSRLAPGDAALAQAIDAFSRTYDVDMGEAEVPEGGFRTFNDFFTRSLRPGARTIDPDPDVLVSPADGKLEDFGPVESGGSFQIKGRSYDAADLLGGAALSERYEGGSYFIVYLSPRDYHRVHAPVTGPVGHLRYVPGTLFPVNRIGTDFVDRVFSRNERVGVTQRSDRFGDVTTVLVGAIGVGRIGLAFDALLSNDGADAVDRSLSGPDLARGEELGRFNLGSTVIVFVPRGVSLRFVPPRGAHVRMGAALARRISA